MPCTTGCATPEEKGSPSGITSQCGCAGDSPGAVGLEPCIGIGGQVQAGKDRLSSAPARPQVQLASIARLASPRRDRAVSRSSRAAWRGNAQIAGVPPEYHDLARLKPWLIPALRQEDGSSGEVPGWVPGARARVEGLKALRRRIEALLAAFGLRPRAELQNAPSSAPDPAAGTSCSCGTTAGGESGGLADDGRIETPTDGVFPGDVYAAAPNKLSTGDAHPLRDSPYPRVAPPARRRRGGALPGWLIPTTP